MWLSDSLFKQVISSTPLISIDLIVRCSGSGRVLLGRRLNKPAKGYWFVPGGRIQKNERIDVAFSRLTLEELGLSVSINNASFKGAYEHLYDDCVFGDEVTTHYVVLGFEIFLPGSQLSSVPRFQHGAYEWFLADELLDNPQVHENTKDYFRDKAGYSLK
ncbi:GDP-mannose mannosyl hydrolase [Spongiibacter tropicus]|uniref:GDP-mannose mannosyl hydrolase n=1 Tax=Spongiibacter tropicus TaxID=454602 RepID=UPI0024E1C9B6|nr:GDP-mannose mannosyl hydrolase [Spongiibacter tropicus]